MDQLSPNNIPIQQNCIFHPQNKLAFIQVNEISSLPNSNIFQCVDCFEQDLQFRGANYMLIQKIIESSDSDFHYKWPPLNDQQIVQNIHLKAKNLNSTQSVLNQINSYFTQLKDEIIKKIDVAQKKAINQALEMPFGKEQILKRYQEISQIQNLKSLVMQDQNKSFALYQKSCKDFIQQVELNKAKNTQLLQELLNQCDQIQQLIDFDRLNKSKIFLLDFLDQLNFFEDQTQSQVSSDNNLNNNILPQQDNNKIDQLMKLISNKTNYCSEEFLNQIRQQMQKLSLFFEQISFDKMNQEGKKAIRFSELNDEKINNVNEYVEHLIKLQNDPQHLQSVKNSFQISNLLNVLDNKFNFISNNYRDNLMRYLIETYPFSKNINTDEMFSEEQSFNILRSLETNYIKEFVKIVKKKQNLNQNQQNFDNSQTYRVQQKILESFRFEKPELENTLKQFPIFDLLLLKEKSILNELQFQKSNLYDGNQRIEIVKNMNNQFEISINQTYYQGSNKNYETNCISQILERDKKYIFRIQFQKGFNGYFMIGLMKNENFNKDYGHNDKMSYFFQIQNNKMNYQGNQGIDKFVKGNKTQLLDENSTLELRVWLEGQQVEVLNYPDYSYKVEIQDQFKQNLSQKDLCLYFHLCWHQDKYILKEALIVEQF
ncbi:hypothetical protein TTHERM_000829473 (macronuclear) [Tetrahymena thermophila SB210]|uniref:Zinc carboxypeptidase family protein n=1 Tax=Tetrahymena thermophila (strain SB210) TaxID=312017 RepID=W7XEE2_TETTS|nr:hypothetical protein TTHERM_000829473 [Tetrahymena thermophila SB210]EWS74978.1 hypothetical protein TTHERM_000829473 [Tetrahymena thermophila SB210]|eukprot:XP_012652477.1 hypothetical protein TTHERM_000829473 [Tetrahymena thermophila SB210]